jgi:hypothetical protein
MLQTAAMKIVLEFALHIRGQAPALLGQMGRKQRVMLFDDPVKKGLLGSVTLVTASIPIPGGTPCRSGTCHGSRPCETVCPYSLSLDT